MVSMLLVRQENSVQGDLPSVQTFRVSGTVGVISNFTVVTGNFLQVIDLIGPAPLPDANAGPTRDSLREEAERLLSKYD